MEEFHKSLDLKEVFTLLLKHPTVYIEKDDIDDFLDFPEMYVKEIIEAIQLYMLDDDDDDEELNDRLDDLLIMQE